jgi:hypothetical protein
LITARGFSKIRLASMGLLPMNDEPTAAGLGLVIYRNTSVPGIYNVKVRVEGCSELSGRSFVRLSLRSILVQ